MRSRSKAAGAIVVAEGYGIRVTVRHGRLRVADGIGRSRRERTYARIGTRPSRLVVLGHAGYITLEALRWLNDIGAGLINLHRDGTLVATSARLGLDDPRLRRLQARAAETWVGVEIAREIMRAKLAGQADILASDDAGDENDRDVIDGARRDVQAATSLDELRTAESHAALAYWRSLAPLPVEFSTRDTRRVPEHWLAIGKRHSPLAAGPRLAVTPYHALTNYLYALLEAEARLACLACGLDPGLGILHADQKARDSLALDLMEPVRPDVDRYLLTLIRERVFRARDFHETRQGSCRLLAPLTHLLADTIPTWRAHVAPVAESAARTLAASPSSKVTRTLTPLTQANRRAAHTRPGTQDRRSPEPPAPELPPTCRGCGAELPSNDRRYCGTCPPEQQPAASDQAAPATRPAANERDPRHGGEAARKRGATAARHNQAVRDWSGNRPDPDDFRRDILPSLQDVPLKQLVATTGFSLRYCSLIRRGERIPHPRHWQSFCGCGHRGGNSDGQQPASSRER